MTIPYTLILLALLASKSSSNGDRQMTPLAFTHVSIIDATGAPVQPDMTVIVDRGRIAAIGRSSDLAAPANATVIDGTGKFLIPGLVDMHVHTTWDAYFIRPLMLANGVTGMREMFARNISVIQQRRREVDDGLLSGPRILAAGPIIDGPGGPWPGSIIATDASGARAAVDRIKSDGYDYVKVYSSLSREGYFAVAGEARKLGIPYAGHLPDSVTAVEGSDAGQKSFEHLYGISRACSSRETELRERPSSPGSYLMEQKEEMESFSEAKATALFARFRMNGTWQVPTLVVMRNAALYADPDYSRTLTASDRLRYVPLALQTMWNVGWHFTPRLTPEELTISRRYFDWELQTVRRMQKSGVGILAGTDTPNPFVYPGFGLHDELGLLVQAGLTPMEALQSATRNPAKFFGTLQSTGTIELGKVADLDLLDANPLLDIGNTRKVEAVVLGGRLIPKAGLEALLRMAADNRWRANPAALTLIGLVVHMMHKFLYATAGALLAGLFGAHYLYGRRRMRVVV